MRSIISLVYVALIRCVTLYILEKCPITMDDIGFDDATLQDGTTVNEGDELVPEQIVTIGTCKIW